MVIQIPEISIIIVGYKAKKHLDACFVSIKHQTIYDPSNIEVIYIDNASFDQSIAHIQRNYKWVSTVRNTKNVEFATALNQGIRYASGEYIMMMNPDVILDNNYLENALKKMKHDKHISAIGGKIYQYDFNQGAKTAYFDTVGIFAYVGREILSARGARDEGQFEKTEEIFSIRNICAMYRKSALEDAKMFSEYFDENFFLYLEDVDMCWRLHLLGWKVMFYPNLIAHHCRDTRKKATIEQYKITKWRAFLINERIMLLKNEFSSSIFGDLYTLIKTRIIKSFRREGWIKGWVKYIQMVPVALKKRRIIMRRKRVTKDEMRKWFVRKGSRRYNYYKSKSLEIYAKLPSTY